jgi:phosphotransferase system HPr-like phosphotransfer protein
MLLAELARKHNGDLKIISKNGTPLSIDCRSIISILLGQILENDEIEMETNSIEVKEELNKIFK